MYFVLANMVLHHSGPLCFGVGNFTARCRFKIRGVISRVAFCFSYIVLGGNSFRWPLPTSTGSIGDDFSPKRHHMRCVTRSLLYKAIHYIEFELNTKIDI